MKIPFVCKIYIFTPMYKDFIFLTFHAKWIFRCVELCCPGATCSLSQFEMHCKYKLHSRFGNQYEKKDVKYLINNFILIIY